MCLTAACRDKFLEAFDAKHATTCEDYMFNDAPGVCRTPRLKTLNLELLSRHAKNPVQVLFIDFLAEMALFADLEP